MISKIIWNVKGINTQGVMEIIKMLKKMHQLDIIFILETIEDTCNVMNLKNQLTMDNAVTNCNGKFCYSGIVILIFLRD